MVDWDGWVLVGERAVKLLGVAMVVVAVEGMLTGLAPELTMLSS